MHHYMIEQAVVEGEPPSHCYSHFIHKDYNVLQKSLDIFEIFM